MPRVTIKQIREGIKGTTLFFVHAPWCPFTVDFYPIFDEVMTNLKEKGIDNKFNVIKLDDVMTRSIRANYGDIYKSLADYDGDDDEYKLFFPTVLLFVNGKRYKYQVNVRTVQNFEAFIMSKLTMTKRRSKNENKEVQVQKGRKNIQQVRTHTFSRNRASTKPAKLLTLEQQIDEAFRKLFKSK